MATIDMSRANVGRLIHEDDITLLLARNNISWLQKWGTETTGTLTELVEYLNDLHVRLVDDGTGHPCIVYSVAVARVEYNDRGKLLELWEDRRVNRTSGRIVPNQHRGIGGILECDEQPLEGIERFLKEKLSFADISGCRIERMFPEHPDPVASKKWPGLMERAEVRNLFRVDLLDPKLFEREHKEENGPWDIYYLWKNL